MSTQSFLSPASHVWQIFNMLKANKKKYVAWLVSGFIVFMQYGEVLATSNQADYKYLINVGYLTRAERQSIRQYQPEYTIYLVKQNVNGKVKYLTRIGFFESRKKAEIHLNNIKKKHRYAWIGPIKNVDLEKLSAWYDNKKLSVDKQNQAEPIRTSTVLDEKKTLDLMEEARVKVAEGEYPVAIRIYSKIVRFGHIKYKQDAQEFLGASRERNGQFAHAKAEYNEYLRLYPDGDGAERVKARLQSILTVNNKPKNELKKPKDVKVASWTTYGYLTEFYRHDNYQQNEVKTTNSSLTSALGVFSRRSSESSDLKLEMTGSHLKDFDDADDDRRRLTSLYIDYTNKPRTIGLRLGRQRHTKSGVLGRIDGVWAEYQLHPQWKINAVTGYPVNLTETNQLMTNRKLQGVSLDIGPFNRKWDFNLFQIEQQVDGVTDREALGGEVRYVSSGFIFFSLLDYDTYFDELNKTYLVSTWRFQNQTTVNVSYDKSKTPYLLTTNALQGQAFRSIEAMRSTYTDEEIKQIAKDRTSTSTLLTIRTSFPVSKDSMLNLDVTKSSLAATPESANVQGTNATGDEYSYGVQLISNNALFNNDSFVTGVRYADSMSYNRTSYSVLERFDISKKWRANLNLFYDQLDGKAGSPDKNTIKPGFNIDYLYSRSLKFEADVTYEESSTKGDFPVEGNGVYFSLGLVYNF